MQLEEKNWLNVDWLFKCQENVNTGGTGTYQDVVNKVKFKVTSQWSNALRKRKWKNLDTNVNMLKSSSVITFF